MRAWQASRLQQNFPQETLCPELHCFFSPLRCRCLFLLVIGGLEKVVRSLARSTRGAIENKRLGGARDRLSRLYCPVSKKIGFCGGGSALAPAGAALKGASKSLTSASGVLVPPVTIVLVVVLMTAIAPASHMPT